MQELENPVESPCFGCGPRHERGLKLRFFRVQDAQGEAVVSEHTPQEDEVGWPGLFHTGLHFTVLFETSYWAILTATERVHVATGTQTFTQERLPRTGVPFRTEARVVGPGRTLARSFREHDGKECARLESAWRPARRADAARAGLELPDYLLEEMEP